MPNIKMIIEYDGSSFHGWQCQQGLRTIQGELHRVLELVTREKISVVHASGRTDAGVHASAQVVSFKVEKELDLQRLQHAVSSLLRGEVGVLSVEVAPDDFHPRGSARRKQYSYIILNRPAPPTFDRGKVWHVTASLDVTRMAKEARSLVGKHDFTSLRNAGCNAVSTVKEIYSSEIVREGDCLIYSVSGTGFLKQMVRNIVGTLVQMGRGEFEGTSMMDILEKKDRREAGVTAPAYGLFLDWVKY